MKEHQGQRNWLLLRFLFFFLTFHNADCLAGTNGAKNDVTEQLNIAFVTGNSMKVKREKRNEMTKTLAPKEWHYLNTLVYHLSFSDLFLLSFILIHFVRFVR